MATVEWKDRKNDTHKRSKVEKKKFIRGRTKNQEYHVCNVTNSIFRKTTIIGKRSPAKRPIELD
jgi:hypothetical protein